MSALIPRIPFRAIYEHPNIQLKSDTSSETAFRLPHVSLHGTERMMNLGGICIVYRDWTLSSPIIMETCHEWPFLKMQFELEGYSRYTPSAARGSKQTTIDGGTHTLMFHPAVQGDLYYPKSRRVLDIEFTVDYFSTLFDGDFSDIGIFGKAIANECPELIGERSLPITGSMKSIIQEILGCPFENRFKKLFLESKTIELLLLQIDQFKRTTPPKPGFRLRNDDRDRLYDLKETIDSDPTAEYSLGGLAQLVGMNDFKLKKGFKTLFGNTVFGYIADVRMERARKLLDNPELNINEIAYLMGYKYPQHFTNAFKKKYGYLPRDVRIKFR